MVYIGPQLCVEPGCNNFPYFNTPGSTEPHYCVWHTTKKMVDVRHQVCTTVKCKERARWNFNGQYTTLVCNKHKEFGMVNVLDI
jgi:hypothetical protein